MFKELEFRMDKYKIDETIWNGEYSKVCGGLRKDTHERVSWVEIGKTGKKVIIKTIKISGDRELDALQNLNHDNIVKLLEHFPYCTSCCLVFERCSQSLLDFMNSSGFLNQNGVIERFMAQLLDGLVYIHENGYIHRDIKPENLLLGTNGILKIADFGLARKMEKSANMTPQMVTICYRPIEILLGSLSYTQAVDLWSTGCVMAELYRGKVLFEGNTEIEMINLIIDVLGTPDVRNWPKIEEMPAMENIQLREQPENRLCSKISYAPNSAIELIQRFLIFDPMKRITAIEAREHEFFRNLE